MRDKLIRKGLVIGIIALFIGASILPVPALKLDRAPYKNMEFHSDELREITKEIKTRRLELDFSIPQIIDEEKYLRVIVKEADSYTLTPGEPLLPLYNAIMKFPLGTEIVDVKCTFSSYETMYLPKKISPAPTPISTGIIMKSTMNTINKVVYENAEWYPSNRYSYHTGGGLDEKNHVTFLSVHVCPLRYSPKNDQIQYVKKVTIEVIFKEPSISLFGGHEVYDLLIISPSEFIDNLLLLVDHKNSHGVLTKLVALEEINGEGRDKQEQLKFL